MKFESGLSDYLDSLSRLSFVQRRLKIILALPKDNPRRQRVLAHVQASAATHLKQEGAVGAIDWGSIDWEKLFAS